jgi:lysophospholipase L1-like esterase
VIDLISARYPERQITYYNEGISGNTVVDLRDRWNDDVIRREPTWVSVKIGINDIHRMLFNPNAAEQIPLALFEEAYRDILTRTSKIGARLVLIDPFYISQDTDPASRRSKVLAVIPEYIDVIGNLAHEFGALRVRTHDLYQAQLEHRLADTLAPEAVHPTASGHYVIAHGLLEALGW